MIIEWCINMPHSLKQIENEAKQLGIRIQLSVKPSKIILHWITRHIKGNNSAPPGSGADIINQLCAYSDIIKKPIELWLLDSKLENYYKTFGFKISKITPENKIQMTRLPKN